MNLLHLHLHVRDRTASERFYEEWFGMRIARRGDQITFLTDDSGFDLALAADPSPSRMPAWFHFGFRLGSAAEVLDLHGRAGRAGLPIVKALYEDESFVSFRLADPDGYPIEAYWEFPGAPLD